MPNTPKPTLTQSVGNAAKRVLEDILAIGSLSAADRRALESIKQEAAGLDAKYGSVGNSHVRTMLYVNDVESLLKRARTVATKYRGTAVILDDVVALN